MARRPTRQRVNNLLKPYSEQVRDAFYNSIQRITDEAELARVVRALEQGDVETAVTALHIDRAVFTELDNAMAQAYSAGGGQALAGVPMPRDGDGLAMVIRFDPRAAEGISYLEDVAGTAIQQITDDQLSMVRNHMRDSLAAGRNPRQVATDIVGKVKPGTRIREGGVLGLTDYQASLVRNARNQLASGDPAQLRDYLSRTLRDKRFDGSVLKAINDGTPLPEELQNRMVDAYKSAMLKMRGETIGRTETMKALHVAQHDAIKQLADKAGVDPKYIKRIWRTSQDKDVRDTHAAMEGQEVGYDEPFTTGGGVQLMYPGDPNGPAEEIISCRCDVEMKIDYIGQLAENEERAKQAPNPEDVPGNDILSTLPKMLSADEVRDVLRDGLNDAYAFIDDAPDDQRNALGYYMRNKFSAFADEIRSGDISEATRKRINALNELLDERPMTELPYVYRGLKSPSPNLDAIDPFLSTAIEFNKAARWSGDNGTVLEIVQPEGGFKGVYASRYWNSRKAQSAFKKDPLSGEAEFLMKGARFEKLGERMEGDRTVWTVKVREDE